MKRICEKLSDFVLTHASVYEPTEGRLLAIPADRTTQALMAFAESVDASKPQAYHDEAGTWPAQWLLDAQALQGADPVSYSERVLFIKRGAMALRYGTLGSDHGVAQQLRQAYHRRVEAVLNKHVQSQHSPGLHRASHHGTTQLPVWQAHWVLAYWNAIALQCGLPERSTGLEYRMTPPAEEVVHLVGQVRQLGAADGLLKIYLEDMCEALWPGLAPVGPTSTGATLGIAAQSRMMCGINRFVPGFARDDVLRPSRDGGALVLHPRWHAAFLTNVASEMRHLRWTNRVWTAPVLSRRKVDGRCIRLHGFGPYVWASSDLEPVPMRREDIVAFERCVSHEQVARWRDRLIMQYLRESPVEWDALPEVWRTPSVYAWAKEEMIVAGFHTMPILDVEPAITPTKKDPADTWACLDRELEAGTLTASSLLEQMTPGESQAPLLVQAVMQGQHEWVRRMARWLGQIAGSPRVEGGEYRDSKRVASNFLLPNRGSILCALAVGRDNGDLLERVVDALSSVAQAGWLDKASLYAILAALDGESGRTVFHLLANAETRAATLHQLLLLSRLHLEVNDSMRLLTQRDSSGQSALSLALMSDAPQWSQSVSSLMQAAAAAFESADGSARQIMEFCLASAPDTDQPAVHLALLADRVGAVSAWVAELPAGIAAVTLVRVASATTKSLSQAGTIQRRALAAGAARAVVRFRTQALKRLSHVRADRESVVAVMKDCWKERTLLQDSLAQRHTTTCVLSPIFGALMQRTCPESVVLDLLEWLVPADQHWVHLAIASHQRGVLCEWLGYCNQLMEGGLDDRSQRRLLARLLRPGDRPPLTALVREGMGDVSRRYVDMAFRATKFGILEPAELLHLLALPADFVAADEASTAIAAEIDARLTRARWSPEVMGAASNTKKRSRERLG